MTFHIEVLLECQSLQTNRWKEFVSEDIEIVGISRVGVVASHQLRKTSGVENLLLVNRPAVFRRFSSDLCHGPLLLRPPVVAAVIKGVVHNHASDLNVVSAILIPEMFERLPEEREANRSEVFRLDGNEHPPTCVVGRRRENRLSG